MNLIECLMKTGLTRHESELYVALCREGELTGYEAAKITGIARANTYQALAAMVDKGAVYVIEGAVPHYTAVPVDEYCRNIINNMQEIVNIIKRECPRTKSIRTVYNNNGIQAHNRQNKKHYHKYKGTGICFDIGERTPFMKKELEEAIRRGLKVVAIISGEAELKGAVIHRIEKPSGQIRLIADSSYVLTGSITGSDSDTCLYSRNRPLVELIKDSLKNEIRLAELSQNTKGTHHID